MIEFEYACDECNQRLLVSKETKAAYASSDGSRLYCTCPTQDCRGNLRRVWGASVQTASVPGFHKNTYATTRAPVRDRGS